MSDSDEDYMSDKLLAGCDTGVTNPGLLFNRSQKRTHEQYKQKLDEKVKKPKTYHEQEKEAREKGLSTAISSDNIGFKLLQKMGYKEGKSLGKNDSGIKEPINVALKESTSGVGREKHIDDIVKKKSELQKEHLQNREKEYLAARQKRNTWNLLRSDFFKSQRTCEELDEREVSFVKHFEIIRIFFFRVLKSHYGLSFGVSKLQNQLKTLLLQKKVILTLKIL
ncbi:hypothetical protein AMK59_8335 [Oryctes borbonicus]|uniref:G-patch domain-containing protein n=1 Tax=Oryctes borbonicus TaxID=1629725 RepID=A0A0T6AXD9_9SCAR|nr:hypothetical protein AMK59_8335 [Oryctes borbonicus]